MISLSLQVEEAKLNRVFKGFVVGPIGKYIKLAPGKERYAEIAELAMGQKCLDRFIVTNSADRVVLEKIRQRARCRSDCGIFQQRAEPRYNIPPPPVPGIETVASALIIEDDLVFNCLGKSKLLWPVILLPTSSKSYLK